MKQLSFLVLAVFSIAVSFGTVAQGKIPYPAALDSAAVVQNSLEDIHKQAFFLGNGDLNALLFSQGNSLKLVVSKNDVWDSRMNTKDDPDLPSVNVREHSWTGTRGAKSSWNDYVYPNQLPCSFVQIQSGNVSRAISSPATGSVTVETAQGAAEVRVLWQANVFLVRTGGNVELAEAKQKFLPPAVLGESEGVQWLKQILPGDKDYAGMQCLTALQREGDCCAVAVVSSHENEDMLAHARRLIKQALDNPEAAVKTHKGGWQEFWSTSGVELAEADLQNWWYRQLYYFRCFSKPGAVAIGLGAGLPRNPGWHGSYKINYNIWQTFWTPFAYNHPELVEPWVEHLYAYLPRARWFAQAAYGCEGAAYFSDTWPHEVDPALCKTKNKHQIAYMPWGYTMGMSGMAIQNLWNYYLYKPDRDYLEARIYPVIKEVAIFYASFIEQCKLDEQDKAIVGPSYSPEHGPFGTDDNPYDLAYTRYTLDAAIEAAEILKVDPALVARWKRSRDLLPPYPSFKDPEQADLPVFADWRGGTFKAVQKYNIVVPVIPLFPAEQFSWFSSDDDKATCKRAIHYVEDRYNRNNSVVILNTARARLSMTDDAMKDTLSWFRQQELPNGLFHWQGHGNFMSEQTAVGALMNEFLLQSVHGIIRVFPAWPKDNDAAFTRLRAQGGFLVSARQKDGKIKGLEVETTVSGTLRLLNPWSQISVKTDGRLRRLQPDARGVVTLGVKASEKLVFTEGPD